MKTAHLPALALALAVSTVSAEDPASSDRALIERVAGSVTVERKFEGPNGLTGYVLSDGDAQTPVIAWITESPRRLVIGNVFDAWGRNLTDLAAEANDADNPITQLMSATVEETWARAERRIADRSAAREPEPADTTESNADRSDEAAATAPSREASAPSEASPEPSSARAPDTDAESAESSAPTAGGADDRRSRIEQAVRENNGVITDPQIVAEAVGGVRALRTFGSTVTEQRAGDPSAARVGIYFDPACPYCKRLVESLDTGRLGNARVDWIPVGFQQSTEAAQRMLADGGEGAAARAVDSGPAAVGSDPIAITEDAVDGVNANEKVMRDTLIGATPTVVIEYPNPEGERTDASVHVGMSAETLMKTLESGENDS